MLDGLRERIERMKLPVLRLTLPEKVDRSRQAVRDARLDEESLLELVRANHIREPLPTDPAFVIQAPRESPLPPRIFKIEPDGIKVITKE